MQCYAVLHGPNLNRLGRRDPKRYGSRTLADITADIDQAAARLGVAAVHHQSNHEGDLIDWLHSRQDEPDLAGVIVNPAGLTRAGWSLRTALADAGVPLAVVHLSELHRHGPEPEPDIFLPIANVYLAGAGGHGYRLALEALVLRHGDDRPE